MNTLLFFIFFGGTTLQLVKCFSDGNFDEMQEICTTMDANHADHPLVPDGTNFPFTITPRSFRATDTTTPLTVTLGTTGQPFVGFMLEARDSNDDNPVGVFSLLDPAQSRLQNCKGANSAVTQVDNQPKTEVKVNWTANKLDHYSFVVTFIGSKISWKRTEIITPSTTTTVSTSYSTKPTDHTTVTQATTASTSRDTSYSTKPTDSTIVTTATTVSTSCKGWCPIEASSRASEGAPGQRRGLVG
ncbi:ferric-chelate reductase 1-like isoform X3 [Astyanax mexicanus]|uniref:ferric-chelate reductase 1-like isoform X3 n=1 Tax=Astyanax mexicanus TaxID=7994 RepID=UPI0020CB566A|nr:ferric-chelate reductase 1-like isoform X3 [Astyanax mexicanus]